MGGHMFAEPDTASVLGKAFLILQQFSEKSASLSLADLCRGTDLSKATIHRLLNTLAEMGVLERVGQRYQIGIRVFEFGTLISPYGVLRQGALPFLEDLLEDTRATVHLAILDGVDVVYIERLQGHGVDVDVPTRVGGRRSAYCTALGKALLAFAPLTTVEQVVRGKLAPRTPYTLSSPDRLLAELATIRQSGIAFDREESKLGVTCVAAPILTRDLRALGAISVTGSTHRLAALESLLAVKVSTSALSIAKGLGTSGQVAGTRRRHRSELVLAAP